MIVFDLLSLPAINLSMLTVLQAVRRINPGVGVGHLLIQRDHTSPTREPHVCLILQWSYSPPFASFRLRLQMLFSNLPSYVSEKQIMVVDPMLATGHSVCLALDRLLELGVKEENILFLNLVSCPEGLSLLNKRFPKIKIITLAIDDHLNEKKYIVPGLGDFGDR